MLAKAELFHQGYEVLAGFVNASKIQTVMLNMFVQPASFSVELFQTIFDLVISMFTREEELNEKESRKLWKPIINYCAESLNNDDKGAGTARYSCARKLLLKYMKGDTGRVWSAKQRKEVAVWLGWFRSLLNLYCRRKNEV